MLTIEKDADSAFSGLDPPPFHQPVGFRNIVFLSLSQAIPILINVTGAMEPVSSS